MKTHVTNLAPAAPAVRTNHQATDAFGGSAAPLYGGPTDSFADNSGAALTLQRFQQMANNAPASVQLKQQAEMMPVSAAALEMRSLQNLADNSPRALQLMSRTEIDPASIPPPSPVAGDMASWSKVALYSLSGPHVQRRASGASAADAAPGADSGPGDALPAPVQESMGHAFNADFSDVRVHQDASAARMGAVAYAQGTDLHFSPGTYDPASAPGRELLGHELAHVVQQRAGVVSGAQGKGGLINADPALEAEADREGARAARGESTSIAGAAAGRQAKPMRGGQHAIQGFWWVVKDIGQGVLEGIAKEAGKEMTKEGLKKAIDDAAPMLLDALDAAMKHPELRKQLAKLARMAEAKNALLDVAKSHAGRIAGELTAWVGERMPALPEHLVPEMVRDLQARIEERLKNSYAAEAIEALREIGGAMAVAGLSQHFSNLVDRQLIDAAGGAVRSAAESAAEPVMGVARTAVSSAQQVQETIGEIALPLPGIKPFKKFGRMLGEKGYHIAHGTEEGAAAISGDMLDPLTNTTATAVEQGQQQAANQIRAPESGVNLATAYKAVTTARAFATADSTDQQLNTLAAPAVDYGMGLLGTAAAPLVLASLPLTLPAAAAAVVPAMLAGGGVALGQRYVMPAVQSTTAALAPHLEAFGNTTVGTPVKKAAQTVHTAANMLNLGLSVMTAPLPYFGGGWDGIDAAMQSAENSVNNLLDSPAPKRTLGTKQAVRRERTMRTEIERCMREAAEPSTAEAAKRELAVRRKELAKILDLRLELVEKDIARAETLVERGQRLNGHLARLSTEHTEISASLDRVRGEIEAEPPMALPPWMFGYAGIAGIGMMNARLAARGPNHPAAGNPFLTPATMAALGIYLPADLQRPGLAPADQPPERLQTINE